ncbi:MAG: dihydrodipicolinate synthase family protein [Bacilli bacterium]
MFKGIMSAIFSVYDKEMNVKTETVKKMVDYQLANGLTGFYVGGNTGECKVLPNRTRKQMLEAVVKHNRQRGKVVVHVGAGRLEDVLDLVEHANQLEVDAIASLPPAMQPYYSMEETLDYYRLLAQKSKHPIFAYVTSVIAGDMLEFVSELTKIDQVIGIKISFRDYYLFGAIKRKFADRLIVLNGPDETLICALALGADGAIGSTYNILPKVGVTLYESFKKGDVETALRAQGQLNDVIDLLIHENLAWWKAPLTLLGFDMGHTVAPQKMPNQEDLTFLKAKLDDINFKELL